MPTRFVAAHGGGLAGSGPPQHGFRYRQVNRVQVDCRRSAENLANPAAHPRGRLRDGR
jgi:hypothetical protein